MPLPPVAGRNDNAFWLVLAFCLDLIRVWWYPHFSQKKREMGHPAVARCHRGFSKRTHEMRCSGGGQPDRCSGLISPVVLMPDGRNRLDWPYGLYGLDRLNRFDGWDFRDFR